MCSVPSYQPHAALSISTPYLKGLATRSQALPGPGAGLRACAVVAPDDSIAHGGMQDPGWQGRSEATSPCVPIWRPITINEGGSAVTYLPFWSWLVHRFGVLEATFFYLLVGLWVVTTVLLVLLYRKSLRLERRLADLADRLATQTRQQQVERLKRDSNRRRSSRRR